MSLNILHKRHQFLFQIVAVTCFDLRKTVLLTSKDILTECSPQLSDSFLGQVSFCSR